MTNGLQKIVFFVLLLGITFCGYRFMIKPAEVRLAEAQRRVDGKIAKLSEINKITAQAQDSSKQLDQLKQAIGFFESKLPAKSQIHKVLEQVTIIAQNNGLKPKTIKTLSMKEKHGYIEQPLKMQLSGNFKSFYSFMLELEKLPRIIKIRELKLNKDKKHDGQINANLLVGIFFQDKNTEPI